MEGLLLIDKPAGISSFDIIRRLRRVSGVRKIGHAGTLDPQATGLMLMLFGPACKQAERFSKLDKEYEAVVRLGQNSSTDDGEGQLEAIDTRQPAEGEIELVLRDFSGEIEQVPPAHSAIKINGRRAYALARAGKDVDMPSRRVTVHEIELLEYAYPELRLRTKVSSGTYIRSLARDLGQRLGTGGYLAGLRRTEVGDYKVADALALDAADAESITANLVRLDR